VSEEDLIKIINQLSFVERIDTIGYERHGVYKQLHVHLLVTTSSFRQGNWPTAINGFRVYYSPLSGLMDWPRVTRYILKNYPSDYAVDKEQICYENYLNHFNGFSE